jgi:hypothetical protein
MAIIKPVRVFSKAEPCTKVDLFNCFTAEYGYTPRPVVEAQGEIGLNSAKYLIKKGYAIYRSQGGVDYYELTVAGEEWLTKGVAAHIARHPDDYQKLVIHGRTTTQQSPPSVRVARTKLKEQ